MWKMLILICASAVERDDCNINTASDVIQGPHANSVIECALAGQKYIADTALDWEGYWPLVKCSNGTRSGNVG